MEVLRGRDVVDWYGARWASSWDWWESEPERVIDRGDGTIIIHAVTRGRVGAGGVDVEIRDTDVYEVDGGWVVQVREVEDVKGP
jgi:ketosteroid isomerase-like protein